MKIPRFTIRLLAAFILASAASVPAAAVAPSVKVSLDSVHVLMGKATPLNIELVKDASLNGTLVIPSDTICKDVEVLRVLEADTSDIGNGIQEIKRRVLLQSFDSGTYRLNPILFVAGADTVRSNRLVLKVLPVDVDSLETIHPYEGVQEQDRHLVDYLPDVIVDYGWWILGLIIVLALFTGVWYFFLRNRKKVAAAVEKPVPPYEKAITALEKLRQEQLCERGLEKEYYTRLTDILRIYLQGRFGINAMEMTSTQIRQSLEQTEEARWCRQHVDSVLEIADFVKFAKVRPLPADNEKAYRSALEFVEKTKPAEPEKQDDGEEEDPDLPDTSK